MTLYSLNSTDWNYSKSNYVVAGLIVEKVSGISLSEYLQQNIFNPLGMSDTHLGTHDNVFAKALNGYESVGNNTYKSSQDSWTWVYGAGGIVSNVDDLLKWDNGSTLKRLLKKNGWKKRGKLSYCGTDK